MRQSKRGNENVTSRQRISHNGRVMGLRMEGISHCSKIMETLNQQDLKAWWNQIRQIIRVAETECMVRENKRERFGRGD